MRCWVPRRVTHLTRTHPEVWPFNRMLAQSAGRACRAMDRFQDLSSARMKSEEFRRFQGSSRRSLATANFPTRELGPIAPRA